MRILEIARYRARPPASAGVIALKENPASSEARSVRVWKTCPRVVMIPSRRRAAFDDKDRAVLPVVGRGGWLGPGYTSRTGGPRPPRKMLDLLELSDREHLRSGEQQSWRRRGENRLVCRISAGRSLRFGCWSSGRGILRRAVNGADVPAVRRKTLLGSDTADTCVETGAYAARFDVDAVSRCCRDWERDRAQAGSGPGGGCSRTDRCGRQRPSQSHGVAANRPLWRLRSATSCSIRPRGMRPWAEVSWPVASSGALRW